MDTHVNIGLTAGGPILKEEEEEGKNIDIIGRSFVTLNSGIKLTYFRPLRANVVALLGTYIRTSSWQGFRSSR